MHVVAHAPHAWFLLEEDGTLYLDVNCSHSAVGFSMLLRLNAHEAQQYREGGEPFLARLAWEVQARARSAFRARDVTAEFGASVDEAVSRWRASDAIGGDTGRAS